MSDYSTESIKSKNLKERCYALSEFIVGESHLEQALVLVSDDDGWGRSRIAAGLKHDGSPFANGALGLSKRPPSIGSELDLVKWLLLEYPTVGEFAKHAKASGFSESGHQFGIRMRGRNSELVLSGRGLDCRNDAIIFSLVFKEGDQPAKTIVDEGVVHFNVYSIDLELADRVALVIGEHRTRLAESNPNLRLFLSEYLSDDVVRVLSLHLSPRAVATKEEKQSQSIVMVRDLVFYVVQTVPTSISSAADWFSAQFGGYSKVLERCWNSAVFKHDRSDVLCHISVGFSDIEYQPQNSGLWVSLSVVPMQFSERQLPTVLAKDLFSAAEYPRP